MRFIRSGDSKRFAILLVLVCVGVWFPNNGARAQNKPKLPSKVSPDLSQRVRRGQRGDRVNAIIQFNDRPTARMDAVLLNCDATAALTFRNFNARVISLPAEAVEALAAQSEVKYISLDKTIETFGHVATTTGAEDARSMTLLPGLESMSLDGTGIGIAILDSGIDADHCSFRNSLGLSRVIVSRDFTGENRTDDPYGHGNHVASLAAGNGQVSNGAYTGVAPGATLLNLRVLNAQGSGSTSNLLAALDWVLTFRATFNIRVVNLSLGTPAVDAYWNDPLCQAVRSLVDAGIV